MIISAECSSPFEIPLVKPFWVQRRRLNQREMCHIILQSDCGKQGIGELAPLLELSRESFKEAHQQLLEACSLIKGLDTPGSMDELCSISREHFTHLYSSVRNALEMALLSMIPQQDKVSVALNGLIMPGDTSLEQSIRQLLDEGYESIKIKVGTLPVEDEIVRISQALDLMRGRALLRLDANQGYPDDCAVELGLGVGNVGIEYFEEPLEVEYNNSWFYEKTRIPVAWDETLIHETSDVCFHDPDFHDVEAFVLKPLVQQGIVEAYLMARSALDCEKKVVFSSGLEGEHALCAYARLAQLLDIHDVAQGLDTWRWLDTEYHLFEVRNGRLEVL